MLRQIIAAIFLLLVLSMVQLAPANHAAANGGGTIAYVRGGTEIRLSRIRR
ncbi:MAG TPA: hypothetical protein VFZ22_01785 [Pyrinomonadaceae bacterium]|nr:hypothetical protein [Pyrinomonadaceae bacterium]